MRFRERAAFIVVALGVAVAVACAPTCPGRPGVDWVEGQIVVAFKTEIATEDAARRVVASVGLNVLGFEVASHVTAIVATPRGDECAELQRFNSRDDVEVASLRMIVHPYQ